MNGKLKLLVKVSGEVRIQGTPLPVKCIEQALYSYIDEKIKATIVKMQKEFKLTFLDLEKIIIVPTQNNIQSLRENDIVFSGAEVEVESRYFIRRSGIRNKSFLTDGESTDSYK